MKNQLLLILAALIGITTTAQAKTFYVAANGSNSNNGTSASTPWQTLSKVNSSFSSIAAGDTIALRRGDVFYGSLVIGKAGASGRPIVVNAYGSGAKPVISGFVTLSSWASAGNGVYQAAAPGAKATLNMVTVNNEPQALGRYPNADEANDGFLKYETFAGTTSITDNELTSATNWTGADVVIRKKLWVIDRCKINNHSGTTISYTNPSNTTYDGQKNFGYFITNDPRTLDKMGEWYFNNSSKTLQMYFGTATPSSYSVKVSCVDTLINITSKNYITINNIAFDGANGWNIYSLNSSNITIQNCDFTNGGDYGIYESNGANILVENCNLRNMLTNSITLSNSKLTNSTIRNCTVKNTGTLAGMGESGANAYKGVNASVSSGLVMEYNKVDTTGYVAMEFQGNNVRVNNNWVNYYCFQKEDGGGIYTWSGSTEAVPLILYSGRVVRDNIITKGMGAPASRFGTGADVAGIHLDGESLGVEVLNNTIFDVNGEGIHTNNPVNVTFRGNTFYNNEGYSVSVMRWAYIGQIRNFKVKNNICFSKNPTGLNFMYKNSALNEPTVTTFQSAVQNLGDIDSNIYSRFNPQPIGFDMYATSGGASVATPRLTLEGWKAFSGDDANGKYPVQEPVTYKLAGTIGSNKFTNSTFTSNILGLTLFGTNVTTSWDNTNKISGGSLKFTFSNPLPTKVGTLHGPIGALTAGKKYIIRVSTYGTSAMGVVKAYFRKTGSPYTNIVPNQAHAFGIGRTDHEFLFTPTTNESASSVVIEIEQNSGTTYIDNLQVFEANATVLDVEDQIRFEYNATTVAKTIALSDDYKGVDGTAYKGSVTLQPFTSKIMIKDTGSVALKAASSAPAINCYGGSATVTVTATGGTAPYTGTGTFTVTAGTYTYTVKDATGATTTTSITVTQPTAALTAVATAGTGNVTVTATGGTAPYTGTGSFTVTAGTYNYTVTDAKGCTATTSITIGTGVTGLKATPNSETVTVSCFGSTSTVAITATGGTSPYTGTGSFSLGAGKGSLKLSHNTSIAGRTTSMYYTIGAVSSTKNYILRFSTLGTTASNKLTAAIRMTSTPWTVIVSKQSATFGTTRVDHEFYFAAPPTTAAASFFLEFDQANGTTYIDNIAFFEADSNRNLISANKFTGGQFESGINTLTVWSGNANHVATWDVTSKISTTNYYPVKDAGNNISVAAVKTAQPSAPLAVSAVAGVLSTVGALVPVTVTATGGTAPYTGTGSFSVGAGTYTYTVTDSKGCSAVTTVAVALVAGRSANTTAARTNNASNKTDSNTVAARVAAPQVAITSNKALTLNAYPNPTTTSFSLMVEGGSNEKVLVSVFSLDGKVMYQTSGNSNTKYTFGNNFMTGMYIVKVIQGTSAQTLKLVKAN